MRKAETCREHAGCVLLTEDGRASHVPGEPTAADAAIGPVRTWTWTEKAAAAAGEATSAARAAQDAARLAASARASLREELAALRDDLAAVRGLLAESTRARADMLREASLARLTIAAAGADVAREIDRLAEVGAARLTEAERAAKAKLRQLAETRDALDRQVRGLAAAAQDARRPR